MGRTSHDQRRHIAAHSGRTRRHLPNDSPMEVTRLVENLDHLGSWGILTTDIELRITGWNRWLEKHSGKSAEIVLGQHLFDVFPDLPVRSLDRYFRQALEGRAGILSQRFHNYLLPLPPTVADSTLMH